MVASFSRRTKLWLAKYQQIPQNCLVRKIQRSPRPGVKQKAGQKPGKLKVIAIPVDRSNCDTHEKVNCPGVQVNTFFGSLLIRIFQKQDYLSPRQVPDKSQTGPRQAPGKPQFHHASTSS
jgi:hypothetical protein